MSGPERRTGGCLCGRLRWEAQGAPLYEGLCCCEDCRRASGSAFVGFQSYPAERARITGEVRESVARARHGGEAVRSACACCGSLVFGGRRGVDDQHTLYAGSPRRSGAVQALHGHFRGGSGALGPAARGARPLRHAARPRLGARLGLQAHEVGQGAQALARLFAQEEVAVAGSGGQEEASRHGPQLGVAQKPRAAA